ncbi:peroxiredoxin family protein [Psychroserpens sp. XS_ASV72]|uniref:peroxiredoxin family protein n=1 Tax=Psychroserpens sp. XS_ASV72 TaxID=3241293 RepID=UPI0035125BA0
MKKLVLKVCIVLFVFSCKTEPAIELNRGTWRAELQISDSLGLPFNFEVVSAESLKIFNSDEVIWVDDISYDADSIVIKMPVFEGYIKALLAKDNLKGHFINESLNRSVPFSAFFGNEERFVSKTKKANTDVSGNWEVVFSPDSEDDNYIAKGVFNQVGDEVTGTFRTTTGDYRYLEGVLDGNTMKLSTFDGAHAFLFTAEVSDSTMSGMFYSGSHWKEPFVGKRNEDFELADANTLTYLKDGYDALEFRFPNAEGELVSLSDERFKNKVVVVQIMGTWCPNCLDETKYYSDYYNANSDSNLEFIALAFEYSKTEEEAFKRIQRLKNDVGVNYPILLAQYGTSSKQKAQEKLPMLNHVLSYPTSIFIDKTGKVRKIHTGFNGPATGKKYEEFKTEFSNFVSELLEE